MKVLVACEFSGRIRDAFARRGHDAWSCDLIKSETPGKHYQGDVRDILHWSWDLMIAHPPCTYLAVSGNRWRELNKVNAEIAIEFVGLLMGVKCKSCIENPKSLISTWIRKPDQIIQPWQFGHPVTKTTCLWLNGLPHLVPTNRNEGRGSDVHWESPGKDRWKNRSRTFTGIAEAMATQWG